MHTVRNRIASRPPITSSALADFKPPIQRTSRQELALLLRTGSPPAAQAPPSLRVLAEPGEKRPQKRRNPKGKKARKAAIRKAAAAAATPQNGEATLGKSRSGKRRSQKPAHPPVAPAVHPVPEVVSEALLDLCLQAEPALALMLPSRPEPLVAMPEPEVEPGGVQVLTLASVPEPLVELPASLTETLRVTATSMMAEAQAVPLPRSRAVVPARRQGLVDVIAFLLRDSGRRLARWSARRHKSRAERDALRRAEVRQRALVSEFDALDALRRNRG